MCVYIYLHNKYARNTLIYYVTKTLILDMIWMLNPKLFYLTNQSATSVGRSASPVCSLKTKRFLHTAKQNKQKT